MAGGKKQNLTILIPKHVLQCVWYTTELFRPKAWPTKNILLQLLS